MKTPSPSRVAARVLWREMRDEDGRYFVWESYIFRPDVDWDGVEKPTGTLRWGDEFLVVADGVTFERAQDAAERHHAAQVREERAEEHKRESVVDQIEAQIKRIRGMDAEYAITYYRMLLQQLQSMGLIDATLRRKLNRHNKQIGGLSTKAVSDIDLIVQGLEMVLQAVGRTKAAKYDPYDYGMVTTAQVLDRIIYVRQANPDEDLDLNGGGEQDGRASVMNRARAWAFEQFAEWLEGYAGSAQLIERLQREIETKPLAITVRNPKGRVVDRRIGDEETVRIMRENAASPDYSAVRGMTIEAEPRSTVGDQRKLKKLLSMRDQRLREYRALYDDMRQIRAKVTTEKSTSSEVLVRVYDHDILVGGMQATTVEGVNRTCQDDLAASVAAHGEGSLWMVWHAFLMSSVRHQGLGVAMYERTIAEVGSHGRPAYLVANRCFTYAAGDLTSEHAKRVWAVLARKYQTRGYVLAII